MESNETIINRVATSALVTFDLEQYYQVGERMQIDIKDQLWQGLIVKEKELRAFVKAHDWSQYKDKFVAITCTADAIVPTWTYMLYAVSLQPYAAHITFGSLQDLEKELFEKALSTVDWSQFQDAKVVLKGCSKVEVPVSIYLHATTRLRAIVNSLMFGEPCSTVPIFKHRS